VEGADRGLAIDDFCEACGEDDESLVCGGGAVSELGISVKWLGSLRFNPAIFSEILHVFGELLSVDILSTV